MQSKIGDLVWSICIAAALIFSALLFSSCHHRTRLRPLPASCWHRPPLPLVLEVRPEAEPMREAFEEAAVTWGRALGRQAFRAPYPHERANVVVVGDGPVPCEIDSLEGILECLYRRRHWVAHVHDECDGRKLRQIIVWHKPQAGRDLYTFALHELGHTLGLDHSSSKASVMFHAPTIGEARITTADTQALRTLYP